MMQLILIRTAPIRKARKMLQRRYGKPAQVEIPQAIEGEMLDVVLPAPIAECDAMLMKKEQEVVQTILREYNQDPGVYDTLEYD